jgi:hypothetical protein
MKFPIQMLIIEVDGYDKNLYPFEERKSKMKPKKSP